MSVEENKKSVTLITEEIWNKGNVNVADEHIAPAWSYHGPFGEFNGAEGFKQMVTVFRNIFPDCTFTIDDMFGEGEKLAVRYTVTGTMKGEMMGIPPTGKSMTISAAYFYRFENGKEVEVLPYSDSQDMMQQLGLVPTN